MYVRLKSMVAIHSCPIRVLARGHGESVCIGQVQSNALEARITDDEGNAWADCEEMCMSAEVMGVDIEENQRVCICRV